MRLSFAHNKSPMVIGVIRQRTVRAAIADIKNCEMHGADGVDLHLSCLEDEFKNVESIRQIIRNTKVPMLGLNYSTTYDNQPIIEDDDARVGLLMKSVEAGIAAVDIQGYTYDMDSKKEFNKNYADAPYSFVKCSPREVVLDPKVIDRQCDLFERIHSEGAEVLISTHTGCAMTCEQVVDLALFLEKRNPDVIKIVSIANSEEDLVEAIKTALVLKREVKTNVHYHAAGAHGKLSRIINPILSGYLIFANDTYHEGSNFEQLDLRASRAVVDNLMKMM